MEEDQFIRYSFIPDFVVFGCWDVLPCKETWRKVIQNCYPTWSCDNLSSFLVKFYSRHLAFKYSHMVSGFKSTSLYPLNKGKINVEKLNFTETLKIS